MALAALARAGMPLVAGGVVLHLQSGRLEGLGQLVADGISYGAHRPDLQFLNLTISPPYLADGRRVSIQAQAQGHPRSPALRGGGRAEARRAALRPSGLPQRGERARAEVARHAQRALLVLPAARGRVQPQL